MTLDQEIIAIRVKRADTQTFDVTSAKLALNPLPHLIGRVDGVGQGQNLIRPRVPFADQPRDPSREHSRFARACSGNHQHGTVDVFDGLTLLRIRLEGSRSLLYNSH